MKNIIYNNICLSTQKIASYLQSIFIKLIIKYIYKIIKKNTRKAKRD